MPKPFDKWDSNKIATLGCWYLHQAFKIIGKLELEKNHKAPTRGITNPYPNPSKYLIPLREKKGNFSLNSI